MPIPQFLPGQTLPAAVLQQLGNDDSYTPDLLATTTDPTLGTNPTQIGLIWLNGQKVDVYFEIVFGTGAAAGSGNYRVALPGAYPFAASNVNFAIGTARFLDQSGSLERLGIVIADTASGTVEFRNTIDAAPITNAAPWTWADTDILNGHFSYLTDFGGA